MRAFLVATNQYETREWQLPDIKTGESIAFRLIDVADDTIGIPPPRVHKISAKERALSKARAKRAYARAVREKQSQSNSN